MYHADANLNLRDYISFAEIQVGGSMREYRLDSQGTIFTDYDAPISYTEAGAYIQGQKRMLDDRLKLTASARYDKAINFKGNISPRISLSYAAGEDKRHNFRASLQTGFRNPTAQDIANYDPNFAALFQHTKLEKMPKWIRTQILIHSPITISSDGGLQPEIEDDQTSPNLLSQ